MMAHFAGFRGISNYIALVGLADDKSKEKLGYYGERIAWKAQDKIYNIKMNIIRNYGKEIGYENGVKYRMILRLEIFIKSI